MCFLSRRRLMEFYGIDVFNRARSFLIHACLVALGVIVIGSPLLRAQTTIAYVQGRASVPQTAQSTVTAVFSLAQTAGNLNVVVVGWRDSIARVQSINDTDGNSYALAVGPTVVSGVASQSIYFAKNIVAAAAGTNTVTITFDRAAQFID